MSAALAQPLPPVWKDRLDLSIRDASELYEDPQIVGQVPHANAIRTALADLGSSAVFCVQGVPTVVIVVLDEYERERVVALHGALWNQGLATLLLVISGDTIRAFSLSRIPYIDDPKFDDRCLVQELDAVADGLAIKDFIYGVESGRLWEHYADYFMPSERIDQVLLNNLSVSHDALYRDSMSTDAAQALLIQTMFIAYLEDREIIRPDDFQSASGGSSDKFLQLLESGDSRALYQLFGRLREKFNGDLFVAPCSFDVDGPQPSVEHAHLQTLARFRSGHEEMSHGGGQLLFWGYDFKYIPIELVSAVYDRFLGAQKPERRNRGAYYTPMFLADTVISSVWYDLPERTRAKGVILDPACGSGIFLVRSFQLLCQHWRQTHKPQTIRWDSLLIILRRLHGWDLNAAAVRVAVFSLYVALLQEVKPPEIRRLIERGRLLPELWGRTLCAQDFFGTSQDALCADVIIGNPPWSSRRKDDYRSSVRWCAEHRFPMPGKEDAWAFVWKSLRHLRKRGVVGFLLPAMGFLHNQSATAVDARRRLIRGVRIYRIVNFSDLRFQLFEGAVRPAALVIFGLTDADAPGYRFDYWTPKADLHLKIRRAIVLRSVDKGTISTRHAEDASVFKRRLWMSEPESKLFAYLAALPKIGSFVREYRAVYRQIDSFESQWIVGNGFQPVNRDRIDDDDYRCQHSETVANVPYLPIKAFRALAQENGQHAFDDGLGGMVRRRGFERGFNGPRILVPRGISSAGRRLRASYLEYPLTFEHIILAISVPQQDTNRAKLLTALLNSRLLFWFAFHRTASFGSERPELQQVDLLRLPFPDLHDRTKTASALVSLIDEAMASAPENFALGPGDDGLFDELDSYCYRYFALGKEEIALVEDATENVIPCVQPHMGASFGLCKPADLIDRQAYANMLVHSMSQWLGNESAICVVLEARNDDLALLHLRLVQRSSEAQYREQDNRSIGEALRGLGKHIRVALPGNFQLVPDFRLFVGNSLYLVKPLQRRYWLRSTAIADADAMAMELHDAVQSWEPDNLA